MIDRIIHGHVIDFISVHYRNIYYFPTFNLADTFISLGIFLIILDLICGTIKKTNNS